MNLPDVNIDPVIEALLDENKTLRWELGVANERVKTFTAFIQSHECGPSGPTCENCPANGCVNCPKKADG